MEKTFSLSQSLLFFWIKGTITTDTRFVKVALRNTILGFIPAGQDSQNIPLKNISATTMSSRYEFKNFLIGAVLILIGLSNLGNSFLFGLILLLLGAVIFLNGILVTLIIQRSGSNYVICVPFYEKSTVQDIQNSIEEALANDIDKTDLNMFFDKKTSTDN